MWFRPVKRRRYKMEIKVGFELSYYAVNPTPMVTMLNIHPSRFADIVGTETVVAEPNVPGAAPSVPIGFYRDSFGNVCGRLTAPAGGVTFRGSALVRDSGLARVVNPGRRLGMARRGQSGGAAGCGRSIAGRAAAVSDAEPLLRDRQANRHRMVAV